MLTNLNLADANSLKKSSAKVHLLSNWYTTGVQIWLIGVYPLTL